MFTLCTLYFVYSVFHVIFLPIPCLHNVVLCLLCVPLATSVYSILSFMLYFCHSFAHIVYIALLCLLCVLTPVLPGHININQSINQIEVQRSSLEIIVHCAILCAAAFARPTL